MAPNHNHTPALHRLLAAAALAAALAGCASPGHAGRRVSQVSNIDALLAGGYDGSTTLGELKAMGDMGIGTFHALDGELIMLEGKIYQARADGTVAAPGDDMRTPFAAVAFFRADAELDSVRAASLPDLLAQADAASPDMGAAVALVAHGRFSRVKVRSVPAQAKPYPPLLEVVAKGQRTYEAENVLGTLVGFRCPAFAKGVNVPGWHLHFIDDARRFGGHVLEISGAELRMGLDICRELLVSMPPDSSQNAAVDYSKDRRGELEQVEKGTAR